MQTMLTVLTQNTRPWLDQPLETLRAAVVSDARKTSLRSTTWPLPWRGRR